MTDQRREGGRWVLPALGGAFLLSGAAGLMHEVVWARLLTQLFGATSLAISTVLAAYMGGLALGSYWIGTRSARLADNRRTYALLELGIGIGALLVPLALTVVEPLYGALWRRVHLSFATFSVLRLALASAILLGPTVLMGATLPVLAEYCARLQGRRMAPQGLYTLNLAGAALGVAAAGFALMPRIGLWGTIGVAAALNVGVGLGVLALPALAERAPPPVPTAAVERRVPELVWLAAFASGLIAMVTQVAWTRVLNLIVGSTTYAFSSVLLVYLVALGLGAGWATRRGARGAAVGSQLALVHALLALGMLAAIYAVNRLPYWYLGLNKLWAPDTLAGIVAMQVAILCTVLLVPVVCAGTILPLALGAAVPAPELGTGPAVGRLYAVNTLGAIVGALLGGFVLVPQLGSQTTLLCVCIVAAVLGTAFAVGSVGPRWVAFATFGALALVAAGIRLRPAWNYHELHVGVFEPERLGELTESLTEKGEQPLYHREGPTASVFVSRWADGSTNLVINARINASDTVGDMITQVLLAQVPLLVAPRTADVFIVGWGSGVTVGSALVWPETRVTAVELEPAVIEASRFFRHVNLDPLRSPRLRLLEDDARHILLAALDTYDVLISEPAHPWVSGVANLFTRDYYQLAARRLRPAGVFAQWLQTYQISVDSFRAIMAAFQSVFPEVYAFQTPDGGDMILVGTRQPLALRLADIERRWNVEATRAELARIGLERPEQMLANLYLGPEGVRAVARGARINTDDNMFVEFNGPRDMVLSPEGAETDIVAMLEGHAPRLETVLADGLVLTSSRERLAVLIGALESAERPTTHYEELLRALDGATAPAP